MRNQASFVSSAPFSRGQFLISMHAKRSRRWLSRHDFYLIFTPLSSLFMIHLLSRARFLDTHLVLALMILAV